MKNTIIMVAVLAAVGLAAGLAWRAKNPVHEPALAPSGQLANVAALPSQNDDDLKVEPVTYASDYQGFFARPNGDGVYPGVVMIHEWWGLNDNIKQMARVLAAEGYAVLAVDLYQGEVATTPERARELVSGLDQGKALAQLQAAVAYLKEQGANKVASLGWCFGGGQSLQLALHQPLDATVIYYGTLVTDATKLSAIRWPVLGIFGDQDRSISVQSVQAFDAGLDQLGVENEIHLYPGVGHGFANPSGANFAPAETKDAWAKTLAFLKRNLSLK